MSIENLVENMFSEIKEEISGTNVFVRFTVFIEIPEKPEGYKSWEDSNGGSEVDWSPAWESEAMHYLRSIDFKIKNQSGEFTTFDFELIESSLRSHHDQAAYEGKAQCWVEIGSNDPEILNQPSVIIGSSNQFGIIQTEISNIDIVDVD